MTNETPLAERAAALREYVGMADEVAQAINDLTAARLGAEELLDRIRPLADTAGDPIGAVASLEAALGIQAAPDPKVSRIKHPAKGYTRPGPERMKEELIRALPGYRQDIAKRSGRSHETVRRYMPMMVADGLVRNAGTEANPFWSRTEQGEALYQSLLRRDDEGTGLRAVV